MTALVNIKSLALLAWALVNASLVLSIGRELGWGENLYPPVPAPVVHPSVPVEIVLPPDFRLPALEKAYSGTLERPLFVSTRRKAPPPPPPPPPAMKKGQFQLLGTTITDELRAAIVKEVANGKVRQLLLNQTINGLLLEQVEPDMIIFTQYNDREELRLKIQPSAKAPPPGQPAVQPAGQPGGVPAPGMAVPEATTVPATAPRIRRGARIPVPSDSKVNP